MEIIVSKSFGLTNEYLVLKFDLSLQVTVSNDGTISEKGTRSTVIILVMRGKNMDPDVFYGRFMEVIRAREWELTASANQGNTRLEGSSSGARVNDLRITMPVVGVSGILRKEQESWESTDKSLQDAFQDLNALMVINIFFYFLFLNTLSVIPSVQIFLIPFICKENVNCLGSHKRRK